ncbi:spore germination protein [Papillibacter cinnamivorans]|uniref:Spore germination protein KA n=1 Tax=Papillibacter cinnamivorans DSM 12816 TaxID=1122930 RepID=A0A1W1YEK1_9FIRM|nr:spore germination protein [Papillibacter cinnamivorans]SMC34640.1 spore germination protein KA [Papillibacter cinnamivorans DSM 12816]
MEQEKTKLSDRLDENIELMKILFHNDGTLRYRYIENRYRPLVKCCLFYIDGMIDNKLMNEDIIRPLLLYPFERKPASMIDDIANKITFSNNVEKTDDIEEIIRSVVYGDTVLFLDGSDVALIFNTKGWITRSISEPEGEKVLRGPREGFNEALLINLTMVRRRLRTQELKMEFQTFGTRSQTRACICYLGNLANPQILEELKKRLETIQIDGTLDVNYINEYIKDAPYSFFKTIGTTERPDIVAGKLLEGRIALFLDGTPEVLTLPFLFIENFQSDDDYYTNYYFSSIGRLLRIFSFSVSISVPAIYVALVAFHHELLPTDLTLSISVARSSIAAPTWLEAILMLLMFEILRETGLRAPNSIGQALSIVGALVIGQAAVEARLISAPMVIIVAFSGITGIMLMRMKGSIIILRFMFLFLASFIGIYGIIFGMMGLLIHLFNMRSFGIPFMNSSVADDFQDNKDTFVRAPWWYMIKRPKFMSQDPVRSASDGDPG